MDIYFAIHSFKNYDSVKDDGILTMLDKDCVIKHDYLLLNYNKEFFSFENAECNANTLRYLKDVKEKFPKYEKD